IQVDVLPVIQTSIIFKNCDVDGTADNFTDFNLNEVNDIITNGNSEGLEFTYYLSEANANLKTNSIPAFPFNNNSSNTVFVRVENTNECYKVTIVNLEVSTTIPIGGIMQVQELESCDDDAIIDGLHEFDLSIQNTNFISQFLRSEER